MEVRTTIMFLPVTPSLKPAEWLTCSQRCVSCSCFCHHVFTYSEHQAATVCAVTRVGDLCVCLSNFFF